MNKFIIETLKPLGVPVYFIKKPQDKPFPVITFNYLRDLWVSNNKTEAYTYEVTLNYATKELGTVLSVRDRVIELFADSGIIVKDQPVFYDEKIDGYVLVLEFNKVM